MKKENPIAAQIANRDQLWQQMRDQLGGIYHPDRDFTGPEILISAILQDFAGMLQRAQPGENVSETYRTEDGQAEIRLQAVRTSGGSTVAVEVRPR